MFHTIELCKKLSYKEAIELNKKLSAFFNAKPIYNEDIRTYEYGRYAKKHLILGIQEVVYDKTFINFIVIRFNPARVLDNGFIQVSEADEVKAAMTIIDKFLNSIDHHLSIWEFSLRRVDYCVNVNVSEQKNVENYIELLKRGKMPDDFNLKVFRDPVSHRSVTYKNSLYLSNKAVTINFYNKFKQLTEKAPFVNAEEAKGILRLEVQFKSRKLSEMKRGIDKGESCFDYFINNQISLNSIAYYLKRISQSGDYYTLSEARNIINQSCLRNKIKADLVKFIYLVNKKRSLEKVLNNKGVLLERPAEEILRLLDGLGINAVTIPSSWGIEYLPNLRQYVYEANKEDINVA